MSTGDSVVWDLLAKRDQLLAEVAALQNKVAGVEIAIAMMQGNAGSQEEDGSRRRGVKAMLLGLLDEASTTGLNASLAVQQAARRGVRLDRGTVSSMLSRFKRDGVAVHDGERYRLKKYVGVTFVNAGGGEK